MIAYENISLCCIFQENQREDEKVSYIIHHFNQINLLKEM